MNRGFFALCNVVKLPMLFKTSVKKIYVYECHLKGHTGDKYGIF